MDLIVLALAKKYVDEVVAGSGVRAGKNCTIQSITPVDGGNNVVFAWTNDDGTAATETLFVADGKAGTAFIPSVSDTGDLSWTNDGGLQNPPPVNIAGPEGPKGAAGVGVAAVVQTVTSPDSGGINEITVKLTDGTEQTFIVKNGEAGATGAAGADGKAGTIFTPSVDPDTGDISWTNDGGLSNPAAVNIRGPQGPAGESAVSAINPRGDYDAAADPPYTKSDYITFTDGNTYVAKVDNPDNTPPTDGTANDPYWQIIAFRGAQGPQGERGLTGADGKTGPAGAVYVPTVSEAGDLSWTNGGGLENPAPVNIIGPRGAAGAVFTPTVTPEGVISWLNDGGLSNPPSVNIRGPEGPTGPAGEAGKDGDTKPLPLLFDSGMITNSSAQYYKITNAIHVSTSGRTNAFNFNFLLNTRGGEEVEIFLGKSDDEVKAGAVRHFSAHDKIVALRRNGNDLYVELGWYANYFRVYHKSGVVPDGFAVEQVTSVPSGATNITIHGMTVG